MANKKVKKPTKKKGKGTTFDQMKFDRDIARLAKAKEREGAAAFAPTFKAMRYPEKAETEEEKDHLF